MVDFGDKLKRLRMAKKLTQTELAERLRLTNSVISAYEMGAKYPSFETLIKIAALFGVTTDFLLGVDERQRLDVTGLSETNVTLVMNFIDALREKK